MAQYQILARKPLGPPGTGPKNPINQKPAVASPPRSRRTGGAPPPAQVQPPRRTPCVPSCATCAHGGGHLSAATVCDNRARIPASGRRCRAPPCATCAHGRRPAGAALAARYANNRAHPAVNYARQIWIPLPGRSERFQNFAPGTVNT
ncbi:hypothetical protein F511_45449 [Dorcoceras hygrometricum]|uniref:Uncharacterized protein n=1 Tax=Dorcoceras hygrometricum TaxID=472368 RepID=A0A2Z6ZW64_9LAMI|nr:hypothetical protein F511_45449 [Dorcoceras hygrometricum]